jgi:hypothetical protein
MIVSMSNMCPTQVVTEFFRMGANRAELAGLAGLRYRSSKHPGGYNVVLFFGREALVLDEMAAKELSWEERSLRENQSSALELHRVNTQRVNAKD